MTDQRIELNSDRLNLQVDVDDDGRIAVAAITGGGTSLRAGHYPPAIELQYLDAPHSTAVMRLDGSTGASRLRYRDHGTEVDGDMHWLVLTAEDPGRASVYWRLRTWTGSAALTSVVEVTNISGDELILGALPSLSLAVTGEAAGAHIGPEDLDMITGSSQWCAENRWQRHPVRDYIPALSPAARHASAKNAHSARALGSWSTGGALPAGVLAARDDSFALAWQVEHNGAWRWDLAGEPAGLTLTLSGPTDVDHQWQAALQPGETFHTVPATVALGAGWHAAVAELTRYRRLVRRPHLDNERLAVIYNDFMNTLMGDPTTERLLPLVDAAADAGAEAFCIDAGWYDTSMQGFAGWWDYVGEWQPSAVRFPGGIAEVLDRIRERGLIPGLWLEPEVVGVRSPMAKRLPDDAFFCRHGHRVAEAGRYHLDLRHPAARAHLDATVDRLVEDLGVGYFKFDYNINPGPGTDAGGTSAGAGLLGHNRAQLDWLDGLLDRHPKLIIENCSSGAMRSDFALLSRLALQSTSDQQDVGRYVPIAVAASMLMLPEQAGSWAYPSAAMDREETIASLSLGLLGRLYLSGLLPQLSEDQQALVREAVAAHRELRSVIGSLVPRWPIGLPGWEDPWAALALTGPQVTLLTVFHRGDGAAETTVPLSWLVGARAGMELVFPSDVGDWTLEWDSSAATLHVGSTEAPVSARTVALRATN
ncbi:MAG TPA: glycoside hydrolase family 36 protein [Propionibacteriaceae bacterium]|nr:glycoside hydrolase family 36 protein [Propionibacteriaceae bacterium]